MVHIGRVSDIVDWRLCLGCGACAYICPESKITLLDFLNEGIRPVVNNGDCSGCELCVEVCPGVQSDFRSPVVPVANSPGFDGDYAKKWGPIAAMWEGYATEPEIRFKGSSGGVITAIAAYCAEVEGMYGTLHTAQDNENPVANRTRLSRTREELISAAGSRYAPASVCDGLALVENAPAPCVVIGKPAEISALRNACALRPVLKDKVGLTLSFFCAETPATRGTIALVRALGADPNELTELRYRGLGWPGFFAPVLKSTESNRELKMPYRESWAFLQTYRPWATQLWPDGGGELADISCGDPWYEEPDSRNPGFSLVVARSEHGRRIIEGAIQAGYLTLRTAEPWKLEKSQLGLLWRRGAIWGRRLASRICGLPVTRLSGLDLRYSWGLLSPRDKLRATVGTLRRIMQRGLFRRLKLDSAQARSVALPMIGTARSRADHLSPRFHNSGDQG